MTRHYGGEMEYCTNCGAQVTGPFCGSCGTPAKSSAAQAGAVPSPPPGSPVPPAQPMPVVAPGTPAKTGVLVWVLAGCGGLVVIVALIFGVIAYKARQFVSSAHRNPAYATARLLVAANPDIEIVSTDEDRGTMTVHNKKTGETLTINLQDAAKGKFVFEQNGKKAEINAHADGDKGSFEIKSSEGSMKFGTDGKTPDWLPSYPGSTQKGVFSSQTPKGLAGSYGFTTNDSIDQVSRYYEDALKKAGLAVTTNSVQQNGATGMGIVSGEDTATKRKAVVTATPSQGATAVSVTFSVEN
jgi:hypothetical protein